MALSAAFSKWAMEEDVFFDVFDDVSSSVHFPRMRRIFAANFRTTDRSPAASRRKLRRMTAGKFA
jgi:hypothetical protein